MFGPWIDMWEWLMRRHLVSFSKSPRFITIHYTYIIALTLFGSIVIFAIGGMSYVDALFFSSGATTQSGLNTIDVNNITTGQQLVLYLIPMFTNPIFIHSSVVFVRLYMFERRFHHIVREARRLRHSKLRARTESRDERDPDPVERGINGRNIVVLHRPQGSSGNNSHPPPTGREMIDRIDEAEEKGNDQDSSNRIPTNHQAEPDNQSSSPEGQALHREITFADARKPTTDLYSPGRLPVPRPAEHHIAFVENQRNPKDKGTLRIPGPRDSDRGVIPQTVDADRFKGDPLLEGQIPTPTEPRGRRLGEAEEGTEETSEANSEEQPVKRIITIEEPLSPRANSSSGAHPNLKLRRPSSLKAPSFAKTISAARTRATTWSNMRASQSREPRDPMPYLSWTPTMGRNSAFIDLTEEQREELGGIEYRALKTLAVILVAYFFFFHIFGVICLLPWIVRSGTYGSVVDSNGQSRAWWGIFTPATFFNDLGFTITADSMISFREAVLPLLLGAFLIIIGNTGFPCMLRFVIWVISRLVPADSGVWEELRFLLDHPRRCFTLLFPNNATWWLFWVLVILNLIDIFLFIVLDLNYKTVSSLPVGIRLLDALFQSASSRTAGTSCVNIAELHPAIQVSYLIMMYIAVFPIAISIRKTNVYEEKSLGVYGSTDDQTDSDKTPSFVGAHLRRQLSFDLWYVVLGLFFIALAEGRRIENTNDYVRDTLTGGLCAAVLTDDSSDKAFTTFSILFEVVSAYGNIGLSLGYPTVNTSFSGQFRTISKLIIVAMQIRGRHRGLPYDLDRAILLPSESLYQKETEDARNRMMRRNSNLSAMMEAAGTAQGGPVRPSLSLNTAGPPQPNGQSVKEEKQGHVD
ncbi:MAG: low affinity potassium transporter [Peltula sp. TS41687]|nr:MAG: low affinity potassium transporter [Peltula sp. TS41687]